MISTLLWILFFYIIYQIYKIFRAARASVEAAARSQQNQEDNIQKRSYSENDVIDADFTDLGPDKPEQKQ